MKKIFSLYVLFLICPVVEDAQTWQWARSCGGWGDGDGTSVCADPSGNAFISGGYSGMVIAGNYSLNAGSGINSYLIKYDTGGNVLWAKGGAGTGGNNNGIGNMPLSVCADSNGNAYIAGNFDDTVVVFGTYTLTNNGINNVFLVKYDPSGNVIWARQAVNTNTAYVYSVSSDANNNTYISGMFYDSTIVFGTYTLTNMTPNAGSGYAMFLTKYDPNGNVIWVKTARGNVIGGNSGFGITVNAEANGNTFVTGAFISPTMVFGTSTLTNGGVTNVFLAKYDAGGNVLWAKSASGSLSDMANSVSADGNGNAYITGNITSPSLVFGTFTLTNTGNQNAFLTKYDANGNALWVRESICNNNNNALASGLSVSSNSCGAFITGSLNDLTAFGSFTISPPPANSVDPTFIAQYNGNGNVIYAEAFPSGGDDWIAVGLDKFSNVYLTGDFAVNGFAFGADTLALTGVESTFLAKLSYTNCQTPDGINEFSMQKNDIKLFPNPNSGQFKIQIEEEIENVKIIILNSLCQKIYSQTVTTGENEINFKKFTSGLYYYSIIQNDQILKCGKISVE